MEWTKTTPIIMYGAATVATTFYRRLHMSINVVAFIDKRADEIDNMFQLPVYNVDSEYLDELKKCAIVIVSVKNIFDHENIALTLLENGFEHILFMPLRDSAYEYTDSFAKRELQQLYKRLQNYDLCFPMKIPSSVGLMRRRFFDSLVISENGDKIIANIPLILVHTDIGDGNEWFDIPILALFPHLDFFAFLQGDSEADFKPYLDIFCLGVAKQLNSFVPTESWYENVFQNRSIVYEKMKMEYDTNSSFFIEQAVEATWNPKGYFNLNGGKHRIAFLANRESLTVPLILNRYDYEKYLNRSKAEKLIFSYGIKTNYLAPYWIPHPLFSNMTYNMGITVYNVFYRLVRWLAKQLYENEHRVWIYKTVNVYNGSLSIFSLLFHLINCNVYTPSNVQIDIDIASLFGGIQEEKKDCYDLGIFNGEDYINSEMVTKVNHVCLCVEDKDVVVHYGDWKVIGVFRNDGRNVYLVVFRNEVSNQ